MQVQQLKFNRRKIYPRTNHFETDTQYRLLDHFVRKFDFNIVSELFALIRDGNQYDE